MPKQNKTPEIHLNDLSVDPDNTLLLSPTPSHPYEYSYEISDEELDDDEELTRAQVALKRVKDYGPISLITTAAFILALTNLVNAYLFGTKGSAEDLVNQTWWENLEAGEIAAGSAYALSAQVTNFGANIFFLLALTATFKGAISFLKKAPVRNGIMLGIGQIAATTSASAQAVITYETFAPLARLNKSLSALNWAMTGATFAQTYPSRTFGTVTLAKTISNLTDPAAKAQEDLVNQLYYLSHSGVYTREAQEATFKTAVETVITEHYQQDIHRSQLRANRGYPRKSDKNILTVTDPHLLAQVTVKYFELLHDHGFTSEMNRLDQILKIMGLFFDHSFGTIVGAAPTFVTYTEKTYSAEHIIANKIGEEANFVALNNAAKLSLGSPGGFGSASLYYISLKSLRLTLLRVIDQLREYQDPLDYVKAITCAVIASASGVSLAQVAKKVEQNYADDLFKFTPDTPLSESYEYLQMLGAMLTNLYSLTNQVVLSKPSLQFKITAGVVELVNKKYTHRYYERFLGNTVANLLPFSTDQISSLQTNSLWRRGERTSPRAIEQGDTQRLLAQHN